MSLIILSQIKCALTKHTPLIQDEELLFDLNMSRIQTECERCHTPLILERTSPNDDKYYFLSEYIQNED